MLSNIILTERTVDFRFRTTRTQNPPIAGSSQVCMLEPDGPD
jgi:hypothetical protein